MSQTTVLSFTQPGLEISSQYAKLNPHNTSAGYLTDRHTQFETEEIYSVNALDLLNAVIGDEDFFDVVDNCDLGCM